MERNARFRSRGSGLSTRILFCDSERDSERLLAAEADLPFNTPNLFLSGIPAGGAIFGSPSCRIEAREVGLPAIFPTQNPNWKHTMIRKKTKSGF
jgi:hypothetical protein